MSHFSNKNRKCQTDGNKLIHIQKQVLFPLEITL